MTSDLSPSVLQQLNAMADDFSNRMNIGMECLDRNCVACVKERQRTRDFAEKAYRLALASLSAEKEAAQDYFDSLLARATRAHLQEKEGLLQRAEKAEAALSSSQERWRPIESAPKDGTNILVWDSRPFWATYQTALFCWMEVGGSASYSLTPTLWMPLPAPPSPEGETL